MRKYFNPKALVFVMFAVVIASASCKSGQKPAGNEANESTELDKGRVEQDVREFVYPLPTSFEVTEMLNRIGASYILSLTNPATNVEKYLTEKSKAINLGIYGADLSYASTYNQKQEIISMMDVSKKLIDALNISGAISPDIIEQVEANQDDKDKLVELITNTFYDTYEYLNRSERGAVSMLVLSGSWVEGLYITTHISQDTYNNKEMVKIVLDQKASLNKLVSLMELVKDNPAVAETLTQLSELNKIYNTIENGAITKEQFDAIVKNVYIVRNQMVE
jgi:hypothetical protein